MWIKSVKEELIDRVYILIAYESAIPDCSELLNYLEKATFILNFIVK